MSDLDRVSAELRQSGFDLVTTLQTTKEIKRDSFEQLDRASKELARLLKGEKQLPRQIINDLYVTAKILENEAPQAKDSALVGQMAACLYMTFDLILLGESHEDRRAGILRVQ